MTPVTLGDVQATLTRDGTLYVLTCSQGEQKAVLTTSYDLMLDMRRHLVLKVSERLLAGHQTMTLRFPDNHAVTITIRSAAILAKFIRETMTCQTKTSCEPSGGCTKQAAPSGKSPTPCKCRKETSNA